MLVVNSLAKSYTHDKQSLQAVSFKAAPGTVTAVIGPSGAGKTTLLRSLNQLISDDAGQVLLDDQDLRQLNKRALQRVRRNIGMIFQNYNLIEPLTVLENVLHGCLGAKSMISGMLSLYTTAEREEALALIDEMGLSDFAYTACRQLSGGQKQRVGIARALMQHPKMLLCDEPIASLDPKSATLVMQTLRQLADAKQLIVIVNLHQVEMARDYADHVIALNQGQLVFDGTPDALSDTQIQAIYA
ncbi:phosphonate ABC transporter ATP-binding protein [Lacticaseibacillus saniviri]|uniref:Phosphonate ABC transporter ATP-binding protein n=1 Tax=Lacticaseibacillus saniviri JCM 17471 = DSM 24301 TaxID=1293598 RepID=A0A0R2MU33_9LACO|nr:phosphonate ABC transporter ATP-binding protein [Lacticaseibacillus saniviri]KRO16999.1 phosphonate ABC transporter ATP-binding protein [Lacticaseibacillus saniviri JCM 17471 = DSM 24301]MCG4281928.1 phosphonate ABC transporter ATP-binding protein [Lacticaseibacillus saniviri]